MVYTISRLLSLSAAPNGVPTTPFYIFAAQQGGQGLQLDFSLSQTLLPVHAVLARLERWLRRHTRPTSGSRSEIRHE